MKKTLVCWVLVLCLFAVGCSSSNETPAAEAPKPAEEAQTAPAEASGSTASGSVNGAKIGISINSLDSPSNFFEFEYCKKFADEAGFEVVATNAQGYAAGQATDIENLVTQGCKVIIVLNGDTDGLTNVVSEAVSKGVKVISLETGWIDGISCMFEKGDFINMAEVYIRMAAETGFKGEIITTGHNDHPAIRARVLVQNMLLQEFTGIKRVNNVYTTYPGTQEVTYSGVETALLANPNVVAIWATQDLEALGALEACKAAGRNDIIICSEGNDATVLENIMNGGNIKYSYVADLEWSCKKAVEVAADLVKGNSVQTWYQMPGEIVTHENAKQYYDKVVEMNKLFEEMKNK